MKRRETRVWLARGAIITALLVPLLLWLSGCWLFNVPPVAGFTISAQTGQAPLTINFSAVPSIDEDGAIVKFEWDFGDGTSGTGENVSHTYGAAGTFVVVLRVTDDGGDAATAQKTIYVLPAEPPGPAASFTASPGSGTSPLTVSFNASASTYEDGAISWYEWDFGDGAVGYGRTTAHTYFSSGAHVFTATLTVYGTDGKTGTATRSVTVTTAGDGTPAAGAPSAQFTIDYSTGVAPLQVTFDPSDSEADEGRTIILYTWSFGDGSATSDIDASEKTHVFTTDTSSEIFSVTLIVTDNEGTSDSITKTVKAYNHRPVAGFEIGNPPDGDGGGNDVQYIEPDVPASDYDDEDEDHQDEWVPDDVVYGNLGALQTVSVVIRSMGIGDARWFDLTDTDDQGTLELADGTDATSTSAPDEPEDGYADHNYSYDAEGQAWDGDYPDWFTNQSWGIRYLYVNWGDNTGTERIDFNPADQNDDIVAWHVYDFDVDGTVYTITVTAEDWLGYQSAAYSRYVTLKQGTEGGGDL